jgi:hypothetical protein
VYNRGNGKKSPLPGRISADVISRGKTCNRERRKRKDIKEIGRKTKEKRKVEVKSVNIYKKKVK